MALFVLPVLILILVIAFLVIIVLALVLIFVVVGVIFIIISVVFLIVILVMILLALVLISSNDAACTYHSLCLSWNHSLWPCCIDLCHCPYYKHPSSNFCPYYNLFCSYCPYYNHPFCRSCLCCIQCHHLYHLDGICFYCSPCLDCTCPCCSLYHNCLHRAISIISHHCIFGPLHTYHLYDQLRLV